MHEYVRMLKIVCDHGSKIIAGLSRRNSPFLDSIKQYSIQRPGLLQLICNKETQKTMAPYK